MNGAATDGYASRKTIQDLAKITAIYCCEVHKSLRKFQIQDLQRCPFSVDCVT